MKPTGAKTDSPSEQTAPSARKTTSKLSERLEASLSACQALFPRRANRVDEERPTSGEGEKL